jgi:hypothetical protein
MSSRLDFRVAKLERAPGAGGVDLRVYGTVAEADADTRPVGSATMIIVTGVVRSPIETIELEARIAALEQNREAPK